MLLSERIVIAAVVLLVKCNSAFEFCIAWYRQTNLGAGL